MNLPAVLIHTNPTFIRGIDVALVPSYHVQTSHVTRYGSLCGVAHVNVLPSSTFVEVSLHLLIVILDVEVTVVSCKDLDISYGESCALLFGVAEVDIFPTRTFIHVLTDPGVVSWY